MSEQLQVVISAAVVYGVKSSHVTVFKVIRCNCRVLLLK